MFLDEVTKIDRPIGRRCLRSYKKLKKTKSINNKERF
jgi:hypothetical protein